MNTCESVVYAFMFGISAAVLVDMAARDGGVRSGTITYAETIYTPPSICFVLFVDGQRCIDLMCYDGYTREMYNKINNSLAIGMIGQRVTVAEQNGMLTLREDSGRAVLYTLLSFFSFLMSLMFLFQGFTNRQNHPKWRATSYL